MDWPAHCRRPGQLPRLGAASLARPLAVDHRQCPGGVWPAMLAASVLRPRFVEIVIAVRSGAGWRHRTPENPLRRRSAVSAPSRTLLPVSSSHGLVPANHSDVELVLVKRNQTVDNLLWPRTGVLVHCAVGNAANWSWGLDAAQIERGGADIRANVVTSVPSKRTVRIADVPLGGWVRRGAAARMRRCVCRGHSMLPNLN